MFFNHLISVRTYVLPLRIEESVLLHGMKEMFFSSSNTLSLIKRSMSFVHWQERLLHNFLILFINLVNYFKMILLLPIKFCFWFNLIILYLIASLVNHLQLNLMFKCIIRIIKFELLLLRKIHLIWILIEWWI